MTNWMDLLDPSEQSLRDCLPESIHHEALERLLTSARQGTEPRPRLERQGDYVLGILLSAVAVPDEDRVYYQEIDFVLTRETMVTVRKTPERGAPFDIERVKAVVNPEDRPGMIAYRLIDEELDDHIEDWSAQQIRRRISNLRHDILHVRRTLSPTRDAIRQIVDDRTD